MARHLGVCHIWIVTCPNGSAESYANPSVSALTTCPLSLRLCAKGDVYPLTAELTLAGNRHFCPVILDLSCCAREGAKRKQMKKPCNKAIVCSGSAMRALKQKYFSLQNSMRMVWLWLLNSLIIKDQAELPRPSWNCCCCCCLGLHTGPIPRQTSSANLVC